MKRSKWIVAVCLIAMFGLAGCSSSSDDPPRFPDPGETTIDDPEEFEADFTQLMNSVVIPLIGTLGTFDPFNPVVAASRMDAPQGGIGCEDISGELGCLTGSAERCPTNFTEITVTFALCEVREGYTVDGTVVASDSGTTIAADWNVSIGNPMIGDVTLLGVTTMNDSTSSYVLDLNMQAIFDAGSGTLIGKLSSSDAGGGCVRQDTDNLEFSAPSLIFVIDGVLTYCDESAWPDGSRSVVYVDDTEDVRLDMVWVSAEDEVTTNVRDNSSGELLAVCTTDLSIYPAPSDCDVLE